MSIKELAEQTVEQWDEHDQFRDFAKEGPPTEVKNYSDYGREYEIFHDESDAKRHARTQTDESREDNNLQDFQVYPLYAGNP